MKNTRIVVVSVLAAILGLLLPTNNNVWSVAAQEGCGFSDPNTDSFELDQLCQELGDDPECFDEHGNLSDSCAERLEAQGSKEYERYKDYLNDSHNERTEYEEEYDEELEIYMHFNKSPNYYGDAVVSTHGHDKRFDFGDKAAEYGSPLTVPYYYEYDRPYESEVCVKNVDSGNKNCEEVYSYDDRVDLLMPD